MFQGSVTNFTLTRAELLAEACNSPCSVGMLISTTCFIHFVYPKLLRYVRSNKTVIYCSSRFWGPFCWFPCRPDSDFPVDQILIPVHLVSVIISSLRCVFLFQRVPSPVFHHHWAPLSVGSRADCAQLRNWSPHLHGNWEQYYPICFDYTGRMGFCFLFLFRISSYGSDCTWKTDFNLISCHYPMNQKAQS